MGGEGSCQIRCASRRPPLPHPNKISTIDSVRSCLSTSASRPSKPPGKNWPQSFYKRHPNLTASKVGALDWKRYNIYDKVVHWFEVISKVLQDPAILQENWYNTDETGVMLAKLNTIKVLIHKDN